MINEAVEKVMNEYFPDDREVVIDKMTLDLGAFNIEDFIEEYKRRLIALMDREFKKLLIHQLIPLSSRSASHSHCSEQWEKLSSVNNKCDLLQRQ
ncbi:hypothetical protein JL102_09195 [Fulvivirga sp. 2943]|uniref:Uncharacterized protein n=1 Tax=Fulvivirga sediminis TaxID=2803949 RepID=A0A937JZ41_9BACT|nr:hypothetical protein [Fulvivirga sediminis]